MYSSEKCMCIYNLYIQSLALRASLVGSQGHTHHVNLDQC